MNYQPITEFRITGNAARVYAGKDALGNLPAEVKRHRAKRAFILCGRSVSQKSDLITRIKALLGESFAGMYDRLRKDTPLDDVIEARDAARACQADLIIAVGGGTAMQGGRVLAILLAEKGAPEEICTQYPEFGAPISPKLMEKKLPIINVLTGATSAQNRGGAPVKAGNARLEFFDPKTSPAALFWDADALMTMPEELTRNSAVTLLWRAVMDMGYTRISPLGHYSRKMVYELTRNALPKLKTAEGRIELCIATYLQNRDATDGGSRTSHWAGSFVVALSSALLNQFEHIGQGEARAAITPTAMRLLGSRDPECMCRIAETLGVWKEGDPVGEAHLRAADEMQAMFDALHMPANLGVANIPRQSAPMLLELSLKNFNADPKRRFVKERELLRGVLDACW